MLRIGENAMKARNKRRYRRASYENVKPNKWKKRLKKRSTYKYANRLRFDDKPSQEYGNIRRVDNPKTKNPKRASHTALRTANTARYALKEQDKESRVDDDSNLVTDEAVLAGRKAIYRSRTYSRVFRDRAKYEAGEYKTKSNGNRYSDQSHSESLKNNNNQTETKQTSKSNEITQKEKKARNKKAQKKRNKRDYAKGYKKSKDGLITMPWEKGSSIFGGKSDGTAKRIAKTFWDHKGKIGIIILIFSAFSVVITLTIAIVMYIIGLTSVISTTTYPSKDEDIQATEQAYNELETALNNQINSMESTHPGYDEYRYQVDEIAHNPYELISYFTVKYKEFTYEKIQDELKELFNRQYTLRVWETIEKRTRTVTKLGVRTVTDPSTGQPKEELYTYEAEEEYDYKILNISLTNKGIRSIALEDFTKAQLDLFDTYTYLHGNRDGIFKDTFIPVDVDHYKIPPEALSDERFRNVMGEAEKYLGYPYVWGGSNPSTSFDCSGFVCYVLNNCGNGWNVGRTTAEGLRQMTTYVSPSDARAGDIIYFQGTYNTAGASHVGIYVGDGMMIHCGNPIQYASINSSYWQQHFFEFGRMP